MNVEGLKKMRVVKFARRKKKIISRIFACALGAALCVWLGATAYRIAQADRQREAEKTESRAQSPIAANRKRDYGEPGFQAVAENEWLILRADYTTGEVSVEEKKTGMVWYSNPQSRDEPDIKGNKNKLKSQISYTSFNVRTEVTNNVDSFSQSVRQGTMEHLLLENGVQFNYSFPATGIMIPLRYTLVEDTLEVCIPADGIQELWPEEYLALDVDILPFFGAGEPADAGYFLVPDGSGALIDFQSGRSGFSQYSARIYDADPGTEDIRSRSRKESVRLPVFGVKRNDSAFLAVVASGEANGVINATLGGRSSSYHQAYSRAIFRAFSKKGAGVNMNTTEETRFAHDCSGNLLGGCDYTVKYFFLSGEDAGYNGMARRYGAYLSSRGELRQSPLAQKQYIVLDVYGAVTIEKNVMGVVCPVVTRVTGYSELREIVRQLKEAGVDRLIVNYIGALKGGMKGVALDTVAIEPALGTEQEFREMIAALEAANVPLFLEAEPVKLYKAGNGYSVLESGVRTFFDAYAVGYRYAPNQLGVEERWNYIHPRLVPEYMRRFSESAAAYGVRGVSMAGIGDTVYTALGGEGAFASRSYTAALWRQSMEQMQEGLLMVHGGNAYALRYADVVTDAAGSGSAFDVETQSVPFYQIALRGSAVLATEPINDTPNYRKAFLQGLASGMSPKYAIVATDITNLIDTPYSWMSPYAWENWADTIAENYREMRQVMGSNEGEAILRHEALDGDAAKIVFASGDVLVVNCGEEPLACEGEIVAPGARLLTEGGKADEE